LRKKIIGCFLAALVITLAGCAGTQATNTNTNTSTTTTTTPATPTESAEELAALLADRLLGMTSAKAAPTGATLEFTIEVVPYSQYPSSLEDTGEDYTVKLTLLGNKRGQAALEYMDGLGMFDGFPYYRNLPPEGYEYVVSRFKFEFYPRTLPGNLTYLLEQGEFRAYSEENTEYDEPGPYIMPWKEEDRFDYYVFPGDVFEMEIATIVRVEDAKPSLYYQTGKRWFRLY
jgi:hypothetical protein